MPGRKLATPIILLGKRSGQDRNPTPLAERARIAHHSETNLRVYYLGGSNTYHTSLQASVLSHQTFRVASSSIAICRTVTPEPFIFCIGETASSIRLSKEEHRYH